jgi:hypothetical protein
VEKELFEMIVRYITKCETKTKKVMGIVYSTKTTKKKTDLSDEFEATGSSPKRRKGNDKNEIMDSLNYLKSKKIKTKKDKESINMLEMILKNM